MTESQNIEFKEIWKDKYLSFANANGGIICIGKNDLGEIVELKLPLHNIRQNIKIK